MTPITIALDNIGVTYRTVQNKALTVSDFSGINVFFDTIIQAGPCTTNWRNSLPAMRNFVNNGGAAYWQFEHQSFNPCNQEKLDAVVNPYITPPTVTTGSLRAGTCRMATSLPTTKSCVLTKLCCKSGGHLRCYE